MQEMKELAMQLHVDINKLYEWDIHLCDFTYLFNLLKFVNCIYVRRARSISGCFAGVLLFFPFIFWVVPFGSL